MNDFFPPWVLTERAPGERGSRGAEAGSLIYAGATGEMSGRAWGGIGPQASSPRRLGPPAMACRGQSPKALRQRLISGGRLAYARTQSPILTRSSDRAARFLYANDTCRRGPNTGQK